MLTRRKSALETAMNNSALHQGQRKPNWVVLADTDGAYTVQMTCPTWIAIPDHPRQRDTRRQAEKGHWELARRATGAVRESLRWVIAADFHGQIFKVQGHARSLLWANGKLVPPDCVFAIVYRCNSWGELLALHSSFDSSGAAESLYDKVSGAYRQHGLTLKSKRLRYGMIVDALWLALRGIARTNAHGPEGGLEELDVYDAVGAFKEELLQLDQVNPNPDVFLTGVVAAALLGLALNAKGQEFFRLLSANEGSKRGALFDPIEGIRFHIERIKKSRSSWVKSQHEDLCARTLAAYFMWLDGEQSAREYWAAEPPPPLDLGVIVRKVQCVKQQEHDANS
jgi:hypothetical protein